MRKIEFLWLVAVVLAASVAILGCAKAKKGEPAEAPISVEAPPAEEPAAEPEAPLAPVYTPSKLDTLRMLDDTLGASEDTLGWDNVYATISLEKNVALLTTLQEHYGAGSRDRTFIDDAINDLTNVKTFLDDKIAKAEGVDPNGTEAKAKKKSIRGIRSRVRDMISPAPAPKKEEPIPEWKGDEIKRKKHEAGEMLKKKKHEAGEMLKRKWAERDKR
ncbi:MAG: hypothetical protein GTN49_09660 [candidate division Zixibacteria bacterium]|nr:hypothetical protein [candidate division Zixibacteria bacterium]